MGPPKFSTWLICSNKGGGSSRSSFSELRPGLGYSTPTVKKVLVLVGFRVGGFFFVCVSLLSLCGCVCSTATLRFLLKDPGVIEICTSMVGYQYFLVVSMI